MPKIFYDSECYCRPCQLKFDLSAAWYGAKGGRVRCPRCHMHARTKPRKLIEEKIKRVE